MFHVPLELILQHSDIPVRSNLAILFKRNLLLRTLLNNQYSL